MKNELTKLINKRKLVKEKTADFITVIDAATDLLKERLTILENIEDEEKREEGIKQVNESMQKYTDLKEKLENFEDGTKMSQVDFNLLGICCAAQSTRIASAAQRLIDSADMLKKYTQILTN